MLICDDFNLVPNIDMDSTAGSKRHASPLDKFITSNELYDVWRCSHTSEPDFTFLSPRHNTFSQIDLFLTDKWPPGQTILPLVSQYPLTPRNPTPTVRLKGK